MTTAWKSSSVGSVGMATLVLRKPFSGNGHLHLTGWSRACEKVLSPMENDVLPLIALVGQLSMHASPQ